MCGWMPHAATTAGCRRAAWGRGHGQGVGEGGVGAYRCGRGKGAALSTLLEPAMPLWERQNLWGCGASIIRGGRMEKKGVFAWWCRVQERGALRWHRDRPNTNGFQPAATPYDLEGGWRSLMRAETCSRVHRLD